MSERPAPPPGFIPPTAALTPSPPLPPIADDIREHGLALSPTILAWIPPVALTVAFVLAVGFSWVGAFPGGYRLLSQSPLGALFCSVDKQPNPIHDDKREIGVVELLQSDWPLMLPYLLALLAAVALSWLLRVFPEPAIGTVPAPLLFLTKVWPRRYFVLSLLAIGVLALIVLQSWRGFGLERAVHQFAVQKHAKELEVADTTLKQQAVQVQTGQDVGSFQLTPTTAWDIALLAHLAAVLGVLGCWWLDRRGPKPLPRVVLRY